MVGGAQKVVMWYFANSGRIFSAYALGMAGFFMLDILSKAYYAMNKTLIPLCVTAGALTVNLILNVLCTALFPRQPELLPLSTSVVFLLGGIAAVSGFSQIRHPDRTYANPACPLYGTPMTVETPNNVTGSLLFESGVLGQITMTSEGGCTANRFVIHCTAGGGHRRHLEEVSRVFQAC